MAIVPETKLAMAARHVAAGRKVVIRQRALVAKQKAGRDKLDSETLLDQFERTLAIFESDLRGIEMESAGRAVTAYGRQPPDQGHLQ
jgi:hypothetical protein